MPGASGTLRGNKIEANLRSGIECSSGTSGLLIEANTVSGHKAGVGILVRAGGCGHWVENLVSGNAVGIKRRGVGLLGKGSLWRASWMAFKPMIIPAT